jgi:hypothetical protein
MRQTISGLIAAIAVMAAGSVPASACGFFESACGQYVAAPVYSGCNCGGWSAYERLPDPEQQYGYYEGAALHQYYYADQGPTFSGPGDVAPYRVYRETAVPVWRSGYYHGHYGWHVHGMRYGYHHGYSLPPREFYGHHSMRYGYHGAPHRYGYAAHMMHRHY